MKSRSLLALSSITLVFGAVLSGRAAALDLYWDADGATTTATGGTGIWNLSSARWRSGSTAGALRTYDNTSPSPVAAYLNANAGAVTIASGPTINVNSLIFDSIEAYTVTGGTLNFSGDAPNVDNLDGIATVASAITGSDGLIRGASGFMPLVFAGDLSGLSGTVFVNGPTALLGSTVSGSENQTWQILQSQILSSLNTGTGSTIKLGALEGEGTLKVGAVEGGDPPAGTDVFEVGALGVDSVFGGVIEDSGAADNPDIALAALSKVGAGTLTLSGSSTHTGGTTVNEGTLKLASGGAAGAVRGAIDVGPQAVLSLEVTDALGYNAGVQVASVHVNGGSVVNAVLSGNENQGYLTSFSLTGGTMYSLDAGPFLFNAGAEGAPGITSNASDVTSTIRSNLYIASGSLNIGVAAGTTGNGSDLSISGILFGGGGVTKTGSGVFTLSSFNQFGGETHVNEGTMVLAPGGGLYQTGSQPGVVNVAAGATIRFDRHDSLGGSGVISPVTVHVNGGTLASNGFYTSLSNSFLNGGTILTNGGASVGFPAFSIRGTVTVGGSAASNINVGTGNFNNVALGRLAQTDSTTFDVSDATGSAASDFNVNTFLSNQNISGGSNGLIKNGAGTMALGGANTYTGATTVNAGTLLVNGSLAAASSVTLADGGILGGVGTVNGTITTSGLTSIISPGAFETGGIGTLNVANTVLTGKLEIQLGAVASDLLNVSGDLDITGATVAFSQLAEPESSKYVIVKYSGNLTGLFAGAILPSGYTLTHDASAKEIYLSGGTGGGFSGYMDSFTELSAADKLADADPDHDGISNLLEYALDGFNPIVGNASPGTFSGGLLAFAKSSLAVGNGDVSYFIEASPTLGAAPNPWTAVTPTSDTLASISYQIPEGLPQQFVRLNVRRN